MLNITKLLIFREIKVINRYVIFYFGESGILAG